MTDWLAVRGRLCGHSSFRVRQAKPIGSVPGHVNDFQLRVRPSLVHRPHIILPASVRTSYQACDAFLWFYHLSSM